MSCYDNYDHMYKKDASDLESKFASPMPWIGMYIAAASLMCTVLMAADVFHGFRSKRFWFPCKLFTLNATSLTLVSIAAKLSLDITTQMSGLADQLGKLSTSVFMTSITGNFMTCLGSMNGEALMMNITAATILFITININNYIQFATGVIAAEVLLEAIIINFLMFLSLLVLIFSALAVTATKKYLEVTYHHQHREQGDQLAGEDYRRLIISTNKLEIELKKLWIMAETSSPQFVMARLVTSSATGLICALNLFILLEASIRLYSMAYKLTKSNYGSSTPFILLIQCTGVVIGTISPVMRWFVAVRFKCYEKTTSGENTTKFFLVESYWYEKLTEWKQTPISLRIGGRKTRKFLRWSKNVMLNFFIKFQVMIVKASKLVLLLSVLVVGKISSCFHHIKRRMMKMDKDEDVTDQRREGHDREPDFEHYVLLLEGEAEFPKRIVNQILYELDRLIQNGKENQPKNLLQLLNKSSSFNGLKLLDHVVRDGRSIVSPKDQPPSCWVMPLVTLMSIAIAIASCRVDVRSINGLISSVTEGIKYVRIVDKRLLQRKPNLENVINTADEVWAGVELYNKWLNEDLIRIISLQDEGDKTNTSKVIIQKLRDIAKKILEEFKGNSNGSLVNKNPRYWPVRVVAADSMYRISNTLLRFIVEQEMNDAERLFDHLSIVIADILSACLTNLPKLIIEKGEGQNIMVEEREQSIRHAARLMGETVDILKLLEKKEIPPSLVTDNAAEIDEWCASVRVNNSTASTQPSQEHVTVDIRS